jgi:transcriptional regulator with XRE-family HTH domain
MKINGEALKAIRSRSEMTITQLATASGIDRTVITRIENGERKGTPAQHKALAIALQVPMQAIAINEVAA